MQLLSQFTQLMHLYTASLVDLAPLFVNPATRLSNFVNRFQTYTFFLKTPHLQSRTFDHTKWTNKKKKNNAVNSPKLSFFRLGTNHRSDLHPKIRILTGLDDPYLSMTSNHSLSPTYWRNMKIQFQYVSSLCTQTKMWSALHQYTNYVKSLLRHY